LVGFVVEVVDFVFGYVYEVVGFGVVLLLVVVDLYVVFEDEE